jgi:hypothetical protein
MEVESRASLDQRLIHSLKDLGTEVKNQGTKKSPLYTIEMELHDPAHKRFIEYCLPDGKEDADAFDDDPVVHLIPPAVGIIPQVAQIGQILMEAGSIVIAYQPLLATAFPPLASIPAIGPPMFVPAAGVPFHHATCWKKSIFSTNQKRENQRKKENQGIERKKETNR